MNEDTVIIAENISKKYCKSLKRSMVYGVCDIARNMFGQSSQSQNLRPDEFWAVNDLSFELKRNETLGLIGSNGSGKTTLLKMLNGIFWPDKGKINIRGKVGALIAVGAGFHPLLTGHENIYLNGAILGFNKHEINKAYDAIVEFADIGDFLDLPVKFYSSGMFVRLGFAIAVHCEPDILLIDEILAVGDIKFRAKCYKKMAEIKSKCAIILVSHSPEMITRMCDKVLLLEKGNMISHGESKTVQGDYFDTLASAHRDKQFISEAIRQVDLDGDNKLTINQGDDLNLVFNVQNTFQEASIINVQLSVFDMNYNLVSRLASSDSNPLQLSVENNKISVELKNLQFAYGNYYVGITLFHQDNIELLYNNEQIFKLAVVATNNKKTFENGVYSPVCNIRNSKG